MKIPIGITDPVPSYRYGLISAVVEAGFEAVAVDRPEAWVEEDLRALLVSVTLPDDGPMLARVKRADPDLVIVALLRDDDPSAYREAVRSGATAAIGWNEPPGAVIDVLNAALEGMCLLPLNVARELAAGDRAPPDVPALSESERRWLRRLAEGATVGQLAAESNYSEREMYRLLKQLYEGMGVETRTEALIKAARTGILRGPEGLAWGPE